MPPKAKKDAISIPVGSTTEVRVSKAGLEPAVYPVTSGCIDVPTDDPNLAHLQRHFAPVNTGPASTANDMGQEPGPTDTPESPAEPQE